jgi:hypothetical protein
VPWRELRLEDRTVRTRPAEEEASHAMEVDEELTPVI